MLTDMGIVVKRWFFGEIVKTWLTNLRRPGGLSSILLARRFSSKKNRLSWKIGSILTNDLKLFCLCYVFLSKVCLLTIFQLCLWKNQTNWLQVEDLAEFQKKSWLSPTKSFTKKRNLNKNYEITSFFLEIVMALAHNVKLRPIFSANLRAVIWWQVEYLHSYSKRYSLRAGNSTPRVLLCLERGL